VGAIAALALPALVLTLAAVAGGEAPPDWRIERIDRIEKLAPRAPVRVENRHGDLRVRVGAAGELALHGVAQRAAPDAPLGLLVEAEDGGWAVRVAPPAGDAGGDSRRRLDLAIAVPADTPLVLASGAGLIEARGFAAPVRATSGAGEIRLRGSGEVDASSESGAVRMAFHPRLPAAPSRFATSTASIEVELPPGADATARLETSGRLTTDFSLAVERVGPLTKRATARLGRGGPELRLVSRTGDLALLERPASRPTTGR